MYTGVAELQNCLGFPAQNVIQNWLGHFLGQEKIGSGYRGFSMAYSQFHWPRIQAAVSSHGRS